MTTSIKSRTARVARTALSLTAPALVLGLVLVSQAQGRINYPPPPAGTLERQVDNILLKERADILRQASLINQQDVTRARLNLLQQQIDQATDPAVIARLQRQFNQQAVRFNTLEVQITRNALVLQNDLSVLNPQKDRLLAQLSRLPRPQNQIRQFIQSAQQQENTYAAVIRVFLTRRPLSPVVPIPPGGSF